MTKGCLRSNLAFPVYPTPKGEIATLLGMTKKVTTEIATLRSQ
jgi:hypothetical protein